MNPEQINPVAKTFKSYESQLDLLKHGDTEFLTRQCGTNSWPQIKWLIEHFTNKGDLEAVVFLLNLKLPKPSNLKLIYEREWLKQNGFL